ncbi:EAL domain-containing protein [Reinekea blandensis]|uniref:EAL domain protein n=1 Tax=Reinekea blandensis MED297 TaxID=314283 RepID=A4BDU9_9GAMM|nr:EAL domain-containing protein [Reinekea blandensis]EAR09708.1 EAL domain protein [Reinekea blandensis MED297]
MDLKLKSSEPIEQTKPEVTWKVLTVEDNANFQQNLINILNTVEFEGGKLDILTASSAQEAAKVLSQHDDIAIVLLDVVMEQDDAGLRLVNTIRDILGNSRIRIIILTGQPGMAPEEKVLEQYDIDHYYEKSDLNPAILRGLIRLNLRTWTHINHLYRAKQGLQMILDASRQIYRHYDLQQYTDDVLAQIGHLLNLQDTGILCLQWTDDNGFEMLSSQLADSAPSLLEESFRSDLLNALKSGLHQFEQGYTLLVFKSDDHIDVDYLVYIASTQPLDDYSVYLLQVFSENIKSGFANVTLSSRLARHAYFDEDTGLYNRQRLRRELDLMPEIVWENGQLLVIEIANYASLIASLGKDFILTYLELLHSRVIEQFSDIHVWARFSPDSLVYLINENDQPTEIDDLKARLEKPYDDIFELHLSIRALVIPLKHLDQRDIEEAFSSIDLAKFYMQEKQIFVMEYSPSIVQIADVRIRMMQQLHADIEAKRLSVVFQPKVELETRKPVGCEALARWSFEEKPVPPDSFINIAQNAGFIDQLDLCIAEQVLEKTHLLNELGHKITVSLNMSPSEVGDRKFESQFLDKVTQTNLEIDRLEVEITEEEPVRDYEYLSEFLEKLQNAGLRIALDDFGKGYSSLMHITKLTVDVIKVDREFVNDFLHNRSSAMAIELSVALAERLGLELIAEGIETEEQETKLKELGVRFGQGYFYAKPMPWDDFVNWLNTHADDE